MTNLRRCSVFSSSLGTSRSSLNWVASRFAFSTLPRNCSTRQRAPWPTPRVPGTCRPTFCGLSAERTGEVTVSEDCCREDARMPPPYLLDTDHCVAYLEPTHPGHVSVTQRIAVFTVME